MPKKYISLVVSCLMALSLVAISCGQAVVEEEEEEEVVEEEKEEEVVEEEEEEEEVVSPEEPQYGGVIRTILLRDQTGFDEAITHSANTYSLKLTNNELLGGDWAKGPSGTGQTDWAFFSNNRMDLKTGLLAESWESPEPGHLILKIRQGIHYGLNPDSEASRLVGGRELTSADILYNLQRALTEPKSYLHFAIPGVQEYSEITAPDKWTVDIKVNPADFVWVIQLFLDFSNMDFPREVIEKYGDINDWRNSVGTGPFFFTDYVPSSMMAFERNPNYFETDASGPGKGNQLPYVDEVWQMIIPDTSTQLAALRTGKVDTAPELGRDDALSMMTTAPGIEYVTHAPHGAYAFYMRTDKEELPFAKKDVRRALMMAIDHNTILDELFGGEGSINAWPLGDCAGYENAYLSLEEAPASVQELYSYNPEKAKQLLTDAGYPDGFTTEVVVENIGSNVDHVSVIKDMWEKVDVKLGIKALESGAYSAVRGARNYDEMFFASGASAGTYARLLQVRGSTRYNASYIDDPYIEETAIEFSEVFNTLDEDKLDAMHKEMMKYVLDQAYAIPFPDGMKYSFWWPWLKDYHGEIGPGYGNTNLWVRYVWIDQALKKEMGY